MAVVTKTANEHLDVNVCSHTDKTIAQTLMSAAINIHYGLTCSPFHLVISDTQNINSMPYNSVICLFI